MNFTTATFDEILEAGKQRGKSCVRYQTWPDVGSRVLAEDGMCRSGSIVLEDEDEVAEYVTACAYAGEENDRSYTPFEFTASEINNRDDSEDAWEMFSDGIDIGIAEAVAARLAAKKGGAL